MELDTKIVQERAQGLGVELPDGMAFTTAAHRLLDRIEKQQEALVKLRDHPLLYLPTQGPLNDATSFSVRVSELRKIRNAIEEALK